MGHLHRARALRHQRHLSARLLAGHDASCPSLDTGVTIRATLANPFPDGVAEPPGTASAPTPSSAAPSGASTTTSTTSNGQSMRWSLGLQRELPGQWVVEGAYVASRSYDLTTDFNANPVPRQYLSTSNVRDQATINFLTANVTNPFAGPAARRNRSTARRPSASSSCGRFPQFRTSTPGATTGRAASTPRSSG